MKDSSKYVLIFICLTAFALTAAPARADWCFCHGTGAVLQEDAVENCAYYAHLGWGLEFVLKKGKTAWVHFPIPGKALDNYSVNQIQLGFDMEKSNAYISTIALWDGGLFVKEIKGKWTGKNKIVNLSLDKSYKIYYGLNVCVLVTNGSAAKDLKVKLFSLGAKMSSPAAAGSGRTDAR